MIKRLSYNEWMELEPKKDNVIKNCNEWMILIVILYQRKKGDKRTKKYVVW